MTTRRVGAGALSIRARILGGFAGIILLVGVGNVYGLHSVSRIGERSAFAREAAFRKVELLLEIETLVKRLADTAAAAVDLGVRDAFGQTRSLRDELSGRLAATTARFPDDARLAADLEDVGRRADENLRLGETLLGLAAERNWDAFGEARRAFAESQRLLVRRVAEVKVGSVRELEDALTAISRLTKRTTTSLAGVGVAALAAAVLIALRLSDQIVHPLRALLARMADAQAGDFSAQASVEGLREAAALSEGFNEMVGNLARREEELRRHRSHLEELVEERTAELETVNQRLQTELEVRQVAETSLAESEDRLWRVLNSVRAGIFIVDGERREVLDANAFSLELLGASREEVLGRRCDEFLYAADPGESLTAPQEGGVEDVEGRLRRADGWFLPVLQAVVPVPHGDRRHLVWSFIDLSEVKLREKALRESEWRYRTLFERAEDAILLLEPRAGGAARVVEGNPAAARMHGYSTEELAGLPFSELDGGRFLGDGRLEALLRGESVTGEIVHRRRDGVEFPMQLSAGPVDYGDVRHVLVFGRDVSEQKRAREELEASNEKLRQSNQDLEEFAYVASHDLQEPLRKVQAFGDRLQTKFGPALGEDGRDYLERMQNAARRMQSLIESLLTYSRLTTTARPFEAVDLGAVAREVLSDLEVRIEQSGALVEVGPLPTLEADPVQMRQLLQNLVGNALKFRRPEEAPVVRVRSEWPEAQDAAVVRICVEDEGIGFEPRHAERIFGMFQRLHGRGEYEGTGVGLAVCRKIAERHGGTIAAEAMPGRGARFAVVLPARVRARNGA